MSKRIKDLFLAAAALAIFAPAADSRAISSEAVPAAKSDQAAPSVPAVPSGPADICGQDERVLLAIPSHDVILYYAYDEAGNRIGRLPAEGWGEYARLVRKDALFRAGYDSNTIIRAGDLEPVANYPQDAYILVLLDDHYVTLEKETGVLALYNKDAELAGQAVTENRFQESQYLAGEILELRNSIFVKVTDYETTVWMHVKRDSHESQVVTDPGLLQYLNHKDLSVYTTGDYLVAAPYTYAAEKGIRGVVMAEDGTVVMDGIEAALTERYDLVDSFYLFDGYDKRRNTAQAVVSNTGSGHEVYGPSLSYLGRIPEIPVSDNSCGSGFVKGLAYSGLDGYTCEGFVFDVDTQSQVPYALKADLYLILKDGKQVEVPADGTPERISSAYYVADTDEGTRVYRIRDKGLMASYARDHHVCLSLGSDGIFLHDDPEQWSGSTGTIYDNEGNPTYHSRDSRIHAFANGAWACRRGVYRGLVDRYGSWILKDTLEWE